MSLIEIEGELERLTPEELRHLTLKSWQVFLAKEGLVETQGEVNETDTDLLAALDEALECAKKTSGQGKSADEVRNLLNQWTSR